MTGRLSQVMFRYLTDENVTRSATKVLRDAGREALESRDVVGPQAADKVLEWIAARSSLVLVSRDRDFRGIIEGVNTRGMRKSAQTNWIRVVETHEARRLAQCLDMIENHLQYAADQGLDLEYIQILEEEVNVKYRFPSVPEAESKRVTWKRH